MQIGQSSFSGGILNNFSSCNSAARLSRSSSSSCNSATRLSQSFLCFDLCFFLQDALQYVAALHLLQILGLLPSLPQLAQIVNVSLLIERSSTCRASCLDVTSSSSMDADIFLCAPTTNQSLEFFTLLRSEICNSKIKVSN